MHLQSAKARQKNFPCFLELGLQDFHEVTKQGVCVLLTGTQLRRDLFDGVATIRDFFCHFFMVLLVFIVGFESHDALDRDGECEEGCSCWG